MVKDSRGLVEERNIAASGVQIGAPKRSRSGYMRLIAAKPRPGARIRLAVRRGFILSDGKPITIRQVLSSYT